MVNLEYMKFIMTILPCMPSELYFHDRVTMKLKYHFVLTKVSMAYN